LPNCRRGGIMVVFKLRLIILGLILTVCLGNSCLLAAEISIPLPADAVKISEKNINVGPIKSTAEIYRTYLTQNKINAFYKKEMLSAGWAQDKSGIFMKNGYTATITSTPIENEGGAIQFMVLTSKLPDTDQVLAARKKNPDKVNFMPIYPGSIQNFLWDTPMGVSGSYGTESSIQEVIFFYKSGMLNYGWSLYSEQPIKDEVATNYPGYNKSNPPVKSSSATLRFHRKKGESCVIMITSITGMEPLPEGEQLVDKNAGLITKTTILTVYNEARGFN
jgi:hypothetical protein